MCLLFLLSSFLAAFSCQMCLFAATEGRFRERRKDSGNRDLDSQEERKGSHGKCSPPELIETEKETKAKKRQSNMDHHLIDFIVQGPLGRCRLVSKGRYKKT